MVPWFAEARLLKRRASSVIWHFNSGARVGQPSSTCPLTRAFFIWVRHRFRASTKWRFSCWLRFKEVGCYPLQPQQLFSSLVAAMTPLPKDVNFLGR